MAVGSATVCISVELFGTARIKAGVGVVPLRVDAPMTLAQFARALAQECPALLGNALCAADADSNAVTIADGYALNRNGLDFLPTNPICTDYNAPLDLRGGDVLLLLSNQAGG